MDPVFCPKHPNTGFIGECNWCWRDIKADLIRQHQLKLCPDCGEKYHNYYGISNAVGSTDHFTCPQGHKWTHRREHESRHQTKVD